jgi:hypothetical protein
MFHPRVRRPPITSICEAATIQPWMGRFLGLGNACHDHYGSVFEDVSAAGLYLFVRGGEVIVAFADGPIDDRRRARLTRHRTAIRTAVIVGHRAIEDARQHALGNLPVAGPGGNVELKCSETP